MSVDVDKVVVTLHQRLTDALPGKQVLDGWNRVTELEPEAVAIGHPPAIGGPSVTVTTVPDEGGFCAEEHEVVVRGSAAAWDGEMEYAVKRSKVQAIMNGIQVALDDDPRLGGIAKETWLAPNQQWFQVSDEEGATVQCDFAITVRMFG